MFNKIWKFLIHTAILSSKNSGKSWKNEERNTYIRIFGKEVKKVLYYTQRLLFLSLLTHLEIKRIKHLGQNHQRAVYNFQCIYVVCMYLH